MDSRSILLALLPIGLTLISYAIIRDLLWGIFLGNKSKKTALRIKGEAKGMEMVSVVQEFNMTYYKVSEGLQDMEADAHADAALRVHSACRLHGYGHHKRAVLDRCDRLRRDRDFQHRSVRHHDEQNAVL